MMSLPDFEKKQWLLVFCQNEEKVSFKNDNIIITNKEDEVIHQSTCFRLFCLMLVGYTYLTSGIIERSKKFAFSIILMNYGMRVYEALMPENRGNVLLRQKQYLKEDFSISKKIITNKIDNQIQLLKNERNKDERVKATIQSLQSYKEKVRFLENDYQGLLGYEGICSRLYFQQYFKAMNWKRRSPRTKIDIPNLLLDIGYTYLFNIVESLLVLFGFDVYKGIYHQTFYQRKSLVCDLVEPFRTMIDKSLRVAYGLSQINEDDFYRKNNQYQLNFKNSKKYVAIFVEEIKKNRLEIFKYIQGYYRAYMKDFSGEKFPTFQIK